MVVIVGETHIRTAMEFDEYFDSVVRPSFDAADLALLESHFDPATTLEIANSFAVPCGNEPMGRLDGRIAPRLQALFQATKRANLPIPVWMDHWEAVPEISLKGLELPNFISRTVGQALLAAAPHSVAGSGVGEELKVRLQARGATRPRISGLDKLADLRTNFCSAAAEQRQDVLVAFLDAALAHLQLLEAVRRGESFLPQDGAAILLKRSLNCALSGTPCEVPKKSEQGHAGRYGMGLDDSLGTFNISIQDRTRLWQSRIASELSTHRRVFVSVGALHLPDLRYREQVHPGLLSRLRQEGFDIRPVRSTADLPTAYLKRAWWERFGRG